MICHVTGFECNEQCKQYAHGGTYECKDKKQREALREYLNLVMPFVNLHDVIDEMTDIFLNND